MQFIKSDINIDFIGKRKIAFGISIAMILISLISLIIHKGPRYGIDFAGGGAVTPASFGVLSDGVTKASCRLQAH